MKYIIVLILVFSCNVAKAEESKCDIVFNYAAETTLKLAFFIDALQQDIEELKKRIAELEKTQDVHNILPVDTEDLASSSIVLDIDHPCLPDGPRADSLFQVPNELEFSELCNIYYCNNCNQRWRRPGDSFTISCCVNHGIDDCCHYQEELVESSVVQE